jgi:hypothetical protein
MGRDGDTAKKQKRVNGRFTLWNHAIGRFAAGEIPQGKRRPTQTNTDQKVSMM